MTSPRSKGAARPLPTEGFADAAAWASWLSEHHASAAGMWMRIAKKGARVTSVTYAEALDVALAWGWIDGQKKGESEETWLQKWTPRGPKSLWSRINRDKAMALVARGEMRAPGLAAIERAKASGLWEAAYEGQQKASVPPDLEAALRASPRAAKRFATLDRANRYAILFRVQTAKKPETRAARIARFVGMLERDELLHP